MSKRMNGPDNAIGWCDFTANPVRGKCKYNCPDCYAEDIRLRFKWPAKMTYVPDWYNYAQVVRLLHERDIEPIIFVGSMYDILGYWVPWEWIQKIFDQCKGEPAWFVFLTQNPKRYSEFSIPRNCIVGTTVRRQSEVHQIGDLLNSVPVGIKKLVSFEPLFEQLIDLSRVNMYLLDWIIAGAQTGKKKKYCPPKAIMNLIEKHRDNSIYVKQIHLITHTGFEVSKNPDEWPEIYRRREFPKCMNRVK